MEHFAQLHKVRREYFPSPPPASTLVEVAKLDHDEQRIEFAATAEERQALATRFGILAVEELSGAAYVHATGGGGARAQIGRAHV